MASNRNQRYICDHTDLANHLLANRYRVETFLGKGYMADVYKVWDQQRAVLSAKRKRLKISLEIVSI